MTPLAALPCGGRAMTEEEWINCTPGISQLAVMTPRRLRLLAVALCRHFGQRGYYDGVPSAFEVIEQFADTGKSKAALRRARQSVQSIRQQLQVEDAESNANAIYSLFIIQVAASENAYAQTMRTAVELFQRVDGLSEEGAWRELFRPASCIVGNPFRPVAFDRGWRSETAIALASGIYAERAFDRLPILADALEEAGCDHPDVLAHCRGPGPHVRGCWVVDLVLNKS
jgi:hypothetical protein